MNDRGVALARALLESDDQFETDANGRLKPGSFRRWLGREFPGISEAEITRGLEIAVELKALDLSAP